MQPVATESGETVPHQLNAKPLGEVFVEFERFAEGEFSSGTALLHIEKAIPPPSSLFKQEALENAAFWRKRKRLSERPSLVKGLSIYLFDRFLTLDPDVEGRIFVRTSEGDRNDLGRLSIENTCDVPLERIDFRNHPAIARSQLLEASGHLRERFCYLDTNFWEIAQPTDVPSEDEIAEFANGWTQLAPYVGAPVLYVGAIPKPGAIRQLMGTSARHSDEHLQELALELRKLLAVTGFAKLYQERAADHLGVDRKSRTFGKIWKLFRDSLVPEQRNLLPKKGRPPKTPIEK